MLSISLFWLWPATVLALTARGRAGNVEYTVYGPSWIWQRNDVNVLFVFKNQGQGVQAVTLQLDLDEEAQAAFSAPGDSLQIISIGPGEEKRAAIVGIKTRGDGKAGRYQMNLSLHAGGEIMNVSYPVEIIRGPAFGSGLFPVYFPIGVALVWCGLIALIIPRYARPGEWKRPSKAMSNER